MHVKQEKAVLEIIHYFGSVDKMSKATGILRPTIYRFLKGQEITESIARRIEAKSKGKFNYKSLISLKTKYYLELEKFPDSLVEVPINSIIIPKNTTYFSDKKELSVSQQSACIDQNNQLIYGLEAIEACKKQGKKSVLAWRISLSNLWNDQYEAEDLIKTFDQIERTAIGITLEIFLGNRQGFRTDLIELVDELSTSEVKKGIKTRSLIAKRVGFASDYIYRQLKKILQHGCPELIYQVRHNKIRVSKAATVANLPYGKQIIQLAKIS